MSYTVNTAFDKFMKEVVNLIPLLFQKPEAVVITYLKTLRNLMEKTDSLSCTLKRMYILALFQEKRNAENWMILI